MVLAVAASASVMLGLAYAEPHLAGARYAETMKGIILVGAGKDHLCPEQVIESDRFCNGLPSPETQWQWSNTEIAPLDPTYGAGLFNNHNSFEIPAAGRSPVGTPAGVRSHATGWDTLELQERQTASYTFTPTNTHDSFSLALVWQRAVSVEDDGALTSDLPDFQVELRDRTGAMVGRSEDPANNVEHIYLPGSLTIGQSYTITVSLKTPAAPTHYGLAWQSCTDALKESLRR